MSIFSGPDQQASLALVRYIVYRTAEDARANGFREDSELRARAVSQGRSFTGGVIGDASGIIRDVPLGWFELHFVRANVSVNISARVPDARGADVLQPDIEQALEATAHAIIKRIDGVVAAKGKVEMSNLPPVRPRTGPMNAIDPNRPPGAK